jgi:hypothetical protein
MLGWWTTTFGGELSPVLREALLPISSQEQCEKAYPRLEITDQFCVLRTEEVRGVCQVKWRTIIILDHLKDY